MAMGIGAQIKTFMLPRNYYEILRLGKCFYTGPRVPHPKEAVCQNGKCVLSKFRTQEMRNNEGFLARDQSLNSCPTEDEKAHSEPEPTSSLQDRSEDTMCLPEDLPANVVS